MLATSNGNALNRIIYACGFMTSATVVLTITQTGSKPSRPPSAEKCIRRRMQDLSAFPDVLRATVPDHLPRDIRWVFWNSDGDLKISESVYEKYLEHYHDTETDTWKEFISLDRMKELGNGGTSKDDLFRGISRSEWKRIERKFVDIDDRHEIIDQVDVMKEDYQFVRNLKRLSDDDKMWNEVMNDENISESAKAKFQEWVDMDTYEQVLTDQDFPCEVEYFGDLVSTDYMSEMLESYFGELPPDFDPVAASRDAAEKRAGIITAIVFGSAVGLVLLIWLFIHCKNKHRWCQP